MLLMLILLLCWAMLCILGVSGSTSDSAPPANLKRVLVLLLAALNDNRQLLDNRGLLILRWGRGACGDLYWIFIEVGRHSLLHLSCYRIFIDVCCVSVRMLSVRCAYTECWVCVYWVLCVRMLSVVCAYVECWVCVYWVLGVRTSPQRVMRATEPHLGVHVYVWAATGTTHRLRVQHGAYHGYRARHDQGTLPDEAQSQETTD